MGRLYFNEETGDFWVSSKYERKPPEGYKHTDHFWLRSSEAKSYFCPSCKKHHFVFEAWGIMPRWKYMLTEWGEKVGCGRAREMVNLALMLGGRAQHYDVVWKLHEADQFEKWRSWLLNLGQARRYRLIKMILDDKIDEAEIQLLAWELT